jgi:6-phosphogluconolactonase (cycloisomerase 2 family)
MSTITLRSAKGSPLTNNEVDANFTNINDDKLEISNNLSDLASASTALTNLGLTATAAEINYTAGVTSAIQTQIDALQRPSIAVTVADSGSGNKFYLDGTEQQIARLIPSVTYKFDQSDSSNSGHPLLLSTTADGTHGGGSSYTVGVTAVGTPGTAGAYTEVKLEQDAPDTLYYYCVNHAGMGGEVTVRAGSVTLVDLGVTASAAELNTLTGITASTSELNTLTGITASTSELNTLTGIPATLTATELGYVDGVTSSIQTQIDSLGSSAGTTLTKTFTAGESYIMTLSDNVLVPVVSVTKEVSQTGVTNNNWDVNSTTENYTRLDSAPATTLDFVSDDDVSAATETSITLSGASQSTSLLGGTIGNAGQNAYMLDQTSGIIYQYLLSTAYDLSSGSYESKTFDVSSQQSDPRNLFFKSDGTKLYVIGTTSQAIYQYSLSTAWDISTASYDSKTFSASSQSTGTSGLFIKPDGTKLYIVAYGNDAVYQYSLSTAWDISTASYDSVSLSVSSQDSTPRDITFNDDGTVLYMCGTGNNALYQYNLTTAYDLSSASYSSNTLSLSTTVFSVTYSSASLQLVIFQSLTDILKTIRLSNTLTLGTGSFASADVGKTIEANSGVFILTSTAGAYSETTAPSSYAQVASGSWEMYGVVFNTTDGDLELSGKSETYDLSSASDDSNSKLISGFDTTPEGIYVKNDGTKIWLLGNSGNDIQEFTMSTPYDLTTMTSVWAVSAPTGLPGDIYWKPDGTSYYISEDTDDRVYQYNVSTAWTFVNDTNTLVGNGSVGGQATDPQIVGFNDDGTKMFVIGRDQQSIFQYSLSTAWLASTASYDSVSYSLSSNGAAGPESGRFNGDGTKLFVVSDSSPESIVEFSMSTAYDISTLSPTGNSLNIQSKDTQPTGLAFADDGKKMYFTGEQTDTIYRYSTESSYIPSGYHAAHTTDSTDTTYWTDINSMTADEAAGDGAIYYCVSTDDRTTWTVIDNTDGERDIVRNNGGTWQYNSNSTYASETWTNGTTNTELATLAEAMEGAVSTIGYQIASMTETASLSVSPNPRAIRFNSDGTKMFYLGSNSVYEYALSTAYTVSSASLTTSYDVSGTVAGPVHFDFKSDGTKLYVLGYNAKTVYQFSLSTAFSVASGVTYDSVSFSVSSQESDPYGLRFSPDGSRMYIAGTNGDDINEYALSSAWVVSSASFTAAFSVASEDTTPYGLDFNADGTKMFVVGSQNDSIYQYSLSSAYTVSTASYDSVSFSTASQTSDPNGVTFIPNGGSLFVAGEGSGKIVQYLSSSSGYPNQMNKTQLDAVTDPNHIALGNDLDLAIIFNMSSGSTVPSSDGVAINYDANVLNQGAILGTDYNYDAPAQDKVRITAVNGANLKVRVI